MWRSETGILAARPCTERVEKRRAMNRKNALPLVEEEKRQEHTVGCNFL
jgi:hypothetical protein